MQPRFRLAQSTQLQVRKLLSEIEKIDTQRPTGDFSQRARLAYEIKSTLDTGRLPVTR